MNILFINFYGEPEDVSSSYYEEDIKEWLIENGHNVETVCPNPVRGLSKKDINLFARKYIEEKSYGKLTRLFVNKSNSNSKFSRTLRMIVYILKLKKYIKKQKENIDCVIYYSNPPIFLPLSISKLCKRLGIYTIYQINDIWPNITNKYNFLKKISHKPILYSDTILTLSEDMKNYIDKYRKEKDTITFKIWPYEKKNIEKVDSHLIDRIHKDKRFKVCYIGNVGEFQNMELLLDIANQLIKNKDIVFYIIGNGRLASYVQDQIQKKSLVNTIYIKKTNNITAQQLYNESDLNIISLKEGSINFCCPSKTSTCILSNRKCLLLVDESNYASSLVKQFGFFMNSSFDAGLIAKQIIEISLQQNASRSYKLNLNNFKEYSKTDNLNKWSSLLNKIEYDKD